VGDAQPLSAISTAGSSHQRFTRGPVSLAPIAVVIKKKKSSSVSSWGLRIPE
jgi:hypothetical protein